MMAFLVMDCLSCAYHALYTVSHCLDIRRYALLNFSPDGESIAYILQSLSIMGVFMDNLDEKYVMNKPSIIYYVKIYNNALWTKRSFGKIIPQQ